MGQPEHLTVGEMLASNWVHVLCHGQTQQNAGIPRQRLSFFNMLKTNNTSGCSQAVSTVSKHAHPQGRAPNRPATSKAGRPIQERWGMDRPGPIRSHRILATCVPSLQELTRGLKMRASGRGTDGVPDGTHSRRALKPQPRMQLCAPSASYKSQRAQQPHRPHPESGLAGDINIHGVV